MKNIAKYALSFSRKFSFLAGCFYVAPESCFTNAFNPNSLRANVIIPDFSVIEPLPDRLAAVDEQRRGDDDGESPDNGDESEWASLGHMRLHCEHDANESLAGDQNQRQDTRDERQHCMQNTRKQHLKS